MSRKAKKPRRARIQFSLRTLLLLVAVLCGLLAWKMHKVKKQQAAVAWVREMGRTVMYDYEVDVNDNPLDNPKPPAPAWLIDQLGVDFFDEVVHVNLNGSGVRDLTPLAGLKSVRRLRLFHTNVSDLAPLAGLTNMQVLELAGTEVVDLSPLTTMTNLRRLNVDNTSVSDLAPLAKLTRLEGFYCQDTPVSDLSPLASHPNMSSLNLTCSQVSDISVLAPMRRLTKLDIRATAIADLSPLAGHTQLRELDIFDTPVTDLTPLANTKNLFIELGGSAMSELLPLKGMPNAKIRLYKFPDEPVPKALESRPQQVLISPIYRTG